MIELRNVAVTFGQGSGQLHAVSDASLTIEKGEIVGIVGYSGAGKSTLVRTINLLTRPTSGQVLVNGEDLTAMSERELRDRRRKIGMIFQHFNLMNSRTVRDNIALALGALDKNQVDQRVDELLALVGISGKKLAYPSELSGGQKQRVAIARALANNPEILLCDEATSALDPETTKSILKLLADLNRKLNLTLVVITHEMQVVKELCTRVFVMDSGLIVEEGSVVEIFSNPKNPLTEKFVRTATNMDEDVSKVLENQAAFRLGGNEIYILTFVGDRFREPFIATLQRDHGITTNILSGNVEFLNKTPFGNLLVAFEGDRLKINEAISIMEADGVRVQRIRLKED
ncbi:ATP-binding cassette domain-containing protein [Proteiniclasticum sp. QWL-01]|uniref:methionine ABC transporter ATP-binding protein n=1 Tax=Proteiniclasticum sp. QWL-01 TaxID=3036945 RepID=UPI00240F5728|nr:ATP-binding cassette domain-containing protein [Proteiniclasticum sp. QWL-01]WFF73023.1 ATP-binding cassette domain-containing protein [Proteiniclasticum sp. QWL-01]